jgi:hypothetical protein
MTYDAQRIAIQERFRTQFSALYPLMPLVFDNVKSEKAAETGYLKLSILNGDAALKGIGQTRLFRYAGVISVDIFVPQKAGIKQADLYAQAVDDIFRGQGFSDIVCRYSSRNDIGLEDNYWRVNISVPFYRDRIV